MSNTYFKQTIGTGNAAGTIELTAEGYAKNAISIRMTGYASAFWALDEKAQDDFIAGMLERRGVNPANTFDAIRELVRKPTIIAMEADNDKQSKIHPANLNALSFDDVSEMCK